MPLPTCEPDNYGEIQPLIGKQIERIGLIIGQKHFPKRKRKFNHVENINGPCLIKVPAWLNQPLGKYYLYFANHRDNYIRLAYADAIDGPYQIYEPGTLSLKDHNIKKATHIASPDIFIDHEAKTFRMYYHSNTPLGQNLPKQGSYVSTSKDGIHFKRVGDFLGKSYLRILRFNENFYAIAHGGVLLKSPDGLHQFEVGPRFFEKARHFSMLRKDKYLHVVYTKHYDVPERILYKIIDISDPDWKNWHPVDNEERVVMVPEMSWEGADQPFREAASGAIRHKARQLRDPCLFKEDGEIFLLYAVAGEYGIGLAKLVDE